MSRQRPALSLLLLLALSAVPLAGQTTSEAATSDAPATKPAPPSRPSSAPT